jgi:hypothetical protein
VRPVELAGHAAAASLAVGAVFFVLHRAGVHPGGFGDEIVHLTAVHYHFTGFATLLIAGRLAARGPRRFGCAAVIVLVAGLVVTPIGFLTEPGVQVGGAVIVVAGLWIIAGGTALGLGEGRYGTQAAPLLWISVVASLGVGALAVGYAVSEAFGAPVLSVQLMAALHGSLAAFGLVFCGLVGWRLVGD